MVFDHSNIVPSWLEEKSAVPIEFAVSEKSLLNLVAKGDLSSYAFYNVCVLAELSSYEAILGLDFSVFKGGEIEGR